MFINIEDTEQPKATGENKNNNQIIVINSNII